jgi:SAM-dependent methyltransferase
VLGGEESREVSELERLGATYEAHHRERRESGEFIFVPERIPLFVAAVGGPSRTVLDLGCRSGAVTASFLAGNRVTGLDVDASALAQAAARGITPVRASAEDPLPFEDGSFDVVVAGELLEHVRDPQDVLRETRRVLKRGGTLVGSVPNAFRLQSRLSFLAGRPPEDDPTHLHMYSPAQIRRLLAGFENVELHFVGGRFRRLHPRLLARDLVFTATAPA